MNERIWFQQKQVSLIFQTQSRRIGMTVTGNGVRTPSGLNTFTYGTFALSSQRNNIINNNKVPTDNT